MPIPDPTPSPIMNRRLRALLVCTALATVPALHAQGDPGKQGGDPPGSGGVDIDNDRPDPAEKNLEYVDPGLTAFNIRVDHDPLRIGPGETGTLILFVMMPAAGARVSPAGGVEIATKQGPLTFGAPKWDPPRGGKSHYDENFLVRIPVTVKPGTPYKKYAVTGSLRLSGTFPSGGGPAGVEEEGGQGVAQPTGPKTGGVKQSFAGAVTVGPPMPKNVGVRRRAKAAPKANGSNTERGTTAPEPGAREKEPEPEKIGAAKMQADPTARQASGVQDVGNETDQQGFVEKNLLWICGIGVVVLGGALVLLRRS